MLFLSKKAGDNMSHHIKDNIYFSCVTLYKLITNGDKKFIPVTPYIPTDEEIKRRNVIYNKLCNALKTMENNQ